MVIFYKKWKKYNEIQLTKNKMDLKNRKIKNHPPSPPTKSLTEGVRLYRGVARYTPQRTLRRGENPCATASDKCYRSNSTTLH